MTKDTLQKVRGTPKFDQVKQAVFNLLEARGENLETRIGVSFVVEEANKHERDEFVKFWIQYVDAVRVAEMYSKINAGAYQDISDDREPCSMLYDTMLIHNNGDVPVCCWDGNGQTNVGNVFKDGIYGVWHGEGFQKARFYHETGQFDKVSFCRGCKDWPRNVIVEEVVVDNILIRRSPLLVYYNRMDRLGTWNYGLGKSVNNRFPNIINTAR